MEERVRREAEQEMRLQMEERERAIAQKMERSTYTHFQPTDVADRSLLMIALCSDPPHYIDCYPICSRHDLY